MARENPVCHGRVRDGIDRTYRTYGAHRTYGTVPEMLFCAPSAILPWFFPVALPIIPISLWLLGLSERFGLVETGLAQEASAARGDLADKEVVGRRLTVRAARPRAEGGGGGGGGSGGGGGGYGGGRSGGGGGGGYGGNRRY